MRSGNAKDFFEEMSARLRGFEQDAIFGLRRMRRQGTPLALESASSRLTAANRVEAPREPQSRTDVQSAKTGQVGHGPTRIKTR